MKYSDRVLDGTTLNSRSGAVAMISQSLDLIAKVDEAQRENKLLRQLSNVRRDPSRLIFVEQLRRRAPPKLVLVLRAYAVAR